MNILRQCPSCLLPALRQYRHNDSDELLFAFDYDTTIAKVDKLEAAVERLKAGIIFEGVSLNNPDMAYLNNILKAKLAGDKDVT